MALQANLDTHSPAGIATYHRVVSAYFKINSGGSGVNLRIQTWKDAQSRYNGERPLFEDDLGIRVPKEAEALIMQAISESLRATKFPDLVDILEDPVDATKAPINEYFNPYQYQEMSQPITDPLVEPTT